mgnify:FL=1
MKSTGIIRQVDELGRIVLPIELRRNLNIQIRDPLEIYVENDSIILRKHQSGCIFCGNKAIGMVAYKDRYICPNCANELKEELQ